MYKKKKDYYPPSVLAVISLLCGIFCLILFWLVPMNWLDFIIYAYLFFFGMAVLLGGYSLVIKRNTRAWTAIVVGSIFIILFLIGFYLIGKVCIVC